VLFIALPVLMKLGIAFWPALAASCAVMAVTYVAYAKVLDHFGLG
jgi:hypothetical protein